MLLTFALILLFEEGRSLLVGNDFYSVPVPALFDFSVPITSGFSYSAYRFTVIGICLVLAALLFLWIERTKMGAIIRAAAEKPEMVDVLGIDARGVYMAVFAHRHDAGAGGRRAGRAALFRLSRTWATAS